MLDQRLAELMQRLLSQEAGTTAVTGTSRRLADELNLGSIRGKTIYLSEGDHAEMRILLSANGYALSPVDLNGLSRGDRLLAGTPNEKAGGEAVKRGRISVKSLAGQRLLIGNQELLLPPRCHVDAEWRAVLDRMAHSAIMLVENYEAFDQIDQVSFDLPDEFTNPLVVYRGDRHESRQDNVIAFLDAVQLPTIAFVDIDPRGLHIAAGCPNLVGIVAPDALVLETALASPATGRRDLFQAQVPGIERFLQGITDDSPLHPLWTLMARNRAGVVQERWLAMRSRCILWTR
jgi:hypothetical protein